MGNFGALSGNLKEKSNRGIIVGLIPRLKISHEVHSKPITTNTRVSTLCKKAGARFIDPCDSFVNKKKLFARHGVHKLLGFVGRQFKYRDKEIILTLFSTRVRPLSEMIIFSGLSFQSMTARLGRYKLRQPR